MLCYRLSGFAVIDRGFAISLPNALRRGRGSRGVSKSERERRIAGVCFGCLYPAGSPREVDRGKGKVHLITGHERPEEE